MSIIESVWVRVVRSGPFGLAGAALAPLLIAGAIRFVVPIGPSDASAGAPPIEDLPEIGSVRVGVLDERTPELDVGFGESPMIVIDSIAIGKPSISVGERDPRDVFKVTSLISGPRPVAVINGRAHSVGEEVGTNWVLEKIDMKAGLVRLHHPVRGSIDLPWSPGG